MISQLTTPFIYGIVQSFGCLKVCLYIRFLARIRYLPQTKLREGNVFTARKRSLRRLCFYTCLSVILFTGWIHSPGRYTPPPASAPLGRYTPPARYPQQVHPMCSACWDTVNKRAVRIPLECILVHLSVILFTVGGVYPWGGLCLGGSLSRKPRGNPEERVSCILLEMHSCYFYCNQNNEEGYTPMPSIIITVTTGTMLKFNGLINGHGLKTHWHSSELNSLRMSVIKAISSVRFDRAGEYNQISFESIRFLLNLSDFFWIYQILKRHSFKDQWSWSETVSIVLRFMANTTTRSSA